MSTDLTLQITVHVYGEDKLDDRCLCRDSDYYGIIGKDLIDPLRLINGQQICVPNGKMFSINRLWEYIEKKIYSSSIETFYLGEPIIEFVQEYNILEKYIIFNKMRYSITKPQYSVLHYLNYLQIKEDDVLQIQILVNSDAGTVFQLDGIKYYFHSNELTRHHEPHVHIDVRNEQSGTYSIRDFRRLDGNVKTRDETKIKKVLQKRQIELVQYWNEHTNGLTIDLNQLFGTILY